MTTATTTASVVPTLFPPYNSFISSSSLQLHSHDYTGAKQTSLFGFRPWQQATQQPCRTPAMSDATPTILASATIDEYVSVYASIASIASVTATV